MLITGNQLVLIDRVSLLFLSGCKLEMCYSNQAMEEFSVGVLEPKCKMLSGSKTIIFIANFWRKFVLFICVCFLYKS